MSLTNVSSEFFEKQQFSSLTVLAAFTSVVGLIQYTLFQGRYTVALLATSLLIVTCTLAPLRFPRLTSTFQAFALIGVFVFINSTVPTVVDPPLVGIGLVYGMLFPSIVFVLIRGSVVDVPIGWRTAGRMLPIFALLGVGIAYAEIRLFGVGALLPTPTPLWLFTALLVGVVAALVEEILFRSMVQRLVQETVGRWIGVLVASTVFALVHSPIASAGVFSFVFLFGLLQGITYDKTDSVASVVTLHASKNVFFVLVPLLGFSI